jgi:thiamine biosynthesis lipoprotein
MKKIFFQSIIPALAILFFSCSRQDNLQRFAFNGEAQGTYYTVTYFAEEEKVTKASTDSLLRAFDLVASLWVSESIISAVNNNTVDFVDDPYFIDLFNISKDVARKTNGAFDFTIGPLASAWGFGFREKIEISPRVIDSLKALVGYEKVSLVEGKIIKTHPNIQFDFNAVAQGYSVDLLGKFLESKNINNYLVDIGGEVLARGKKPDGSRWLIGIEKPAEDAGAERSLQATIELTDQAIATSGNYRKFYEKDGIRYPHTINPQTGYPVTHTLLSATVIAENAAIADAYATAFMVLGKEKSIAFLEDKKMEVFFIYSDVDGTLKTWASPSISEKINE